VSLEASADTAPVTIVAHDIGPVRGMERQLTDLVVGLQRLGREVVVIARKCELPPGVSVTFHRVPGPSRPFVIAYPWFMVLGSLAVRRWRRGLVQATGAIVLNRVDVVAVHYSQQVGTATPSRSTLLFRLHIKLAGVLKRAGERLCFHRSRAATFVGVSEGVAAEVREHYPGVAERVLAIHNGIDTELFAPGSRESSALAARLELGVPAERLLLAFVGSEWERKGLAAVIRALPQAGGWDLVVAGGGDRDRYQVLAESLGVSGAVHWLGVIQDVQLVYGMADAFVMASSYETFSYVTFEAASSGLPILATDVNGVRELIEDGSSGFLITPDPDVIAERLRRLEADPLMRSRLGDAARQAALAFSCERMVREHDALYTRLASNTRA